MITSRSGRQRLSIKPLRLILIGALQPWDNPFITGAMTQAVCVVLMVAVSFVTRPREAEAIAPLTFSVKNLRLPADEPKRPFYQSVPFWWVLFVAFYVGLYVWLWQDNPLPTSAQRIRDALFGVPYAQTDSAERADERFARSVRSRANLRRRCSSVIMSLEELGTIRLQ